jgi:hypothetical protein
MGEQVSSDVSAEVDRVILDWTTDAGLRALVVQFGLNRHYGILFTGDADTFFRLHVER